MAFNLPPLQSGVPTHSAIANPTPYPPPTINGSIPLSKWEIKGKPIKVEKLITQEMYQQIPHDEIKKMLYKDLLDSLIAANCIEYTMVKDPQQRDMVHIRGRIFVTPDDQVRILRVNGVI